MEAGRASATAERAALMRAAHQILDHPQILDDPVVLRLIGAERESALRGNLQAFERPDLRRLRASMAVRSRFAEDNLGDAVRRGVHQYVILGAGLDTFAYRNPFPPSALHVYEVDHPDTQGGKRRRLREAGIEIPASLTFVPIDFERQTLAEAMAGSGLDTTQPAFISWLGVTMYLSREAVMRTLAWVSSLAPGSEIVFEYMPAPHLLPAASRAAVSALAERAAAAGEPWLAYFDPAGLERALARLGFAPVEDFGPEQAFERYCRGRVDGLRSGRAAHLLKARVSAPATT
jgi:methyltransferase (TIGR00027 family)